MSDKLTIEGKDNFGKSRQEFCDNIAAMDDPSFLQLAERKIWLSAYARNNIRSDYHWQADACYDEAKRRSRPELYQTAWERAAGQ